MGWGMNASNMHTAKLDKYTVLDTAVYLNWTDKKVKTKNIMVDINFNPLSLNGDQHQFSPNHIHGLSRD